MNDLASADYAVIIGFFAVMIAIGLYFHRRMRNVTDFFGAGRQVPWWLAGISFYMCSFSALGFVIYSALAYQYGWVAVTLYWVTVPGGLLGAYLFASRWRRVAETSPLEYIEHRFGNKMRQALVWLGIPTRLLDDGLKLLAIGTVVAVSLGFPLKSAIICSGIIMVSYTFMGGLWAALVADSIQFVVLVAAVIVLPFLVLNRTGGVHVFIDQAPEGFFSLFTAKYSPSYIVFFFVIILLNYSTSWALVQRYYSSNSDRNARKVGYLVAFLNIISPPLFFLPAMAARVLIPDIPPESANEIYAIICKTVLPIGMLGMLIAAMFSATMSMLAGDFNAVASVLTNDVYKRMLSRDASQRSLLLVSRINTLVVGALVIAVAFMIKYAQDQGSKDLFEIMATIFGLFMPPVAIPMLAGMLTKRISNAGALTGLLLGIASGLIAFAFATPYPVLLELQVVTSITSLSTLVGMLAGTVISPDTTPQRQKVDDFFIKVNTPSTADPLQHDSTSRISPLPPIGLGVIAIGVVLLASVLLTVPLSESTLSLSVASAMIFTGTTICLLTHRSKG